MKKGFILALLALPAIAFAQVGQGVVDIVTAVGNIVRLAVPILVTLAVAVFFWGLVKYIMNANDEGAKAEGKTLMIWGMIAIFVMVALWAILGWFQNLLGITGTIDEGTAPVVVTPATTVQ